MPQADKFWNPHHPRDEHGMPLDEEEELYSLENILGESDPLRKRFLDREATGGLSHRDVRRGGLHLGYCIFCSHGDGHGAPQGLPLLREDNTLLLSKLVAPDGRILPRRFTGVCAKHQRSVSRTIKRSRAMGFMPFQKKLPPQLRYTSMNPDPVRPTQSKRLRAPRCLALPCPGLHVMHFLLHPLRALRPLRLRSCSNCFPAGPGAPRVHAP